MTKNEFTEFKSDVLKELSELIKITGDPFLIRTKRSVENNRYNHDIEEYVLSGGSPTECVDLLISLDGRGNLTDF